VLVPDNETGVLSTHLKADGAYHDLLYCTGGVSRGTPPEGNLVRMVGGEVFKLAVTKLGQIVDETLAFHGLSKDAIDWLVPHQANIRIIQATARKLDMPMERVIVTVQEHGNTSTASVPLALDVGVRDGRIQRGEMLLLEAFGGGLTWGSALLRY
jgi:3-oxoacyl-[acyl-carrier-protein] synthase-3